jgi:hypothetical protein
MGAILFVILFVGRGIKSLINQATCPPSWTPKLYSILLLKTGNLYTDVYNDEYKQQFDIKITTRYQP